MSKYLMIKTGEEGEEKEHKLEFTMLKTSQSLKFLMYMGKIIGGSAGKVVGSFGGKVSGMEDLMSLSEKDVDLEKIGDALFGLFDRIDEDEVLDKLNLLFSSIRHEGNIVDLDYFLFDGRPDLILKVAGKALAVNYKRFLGEKNGALSKIFKSIEILKNGKKSPVVPT